MKTTLFALLIIALGGAGVWWYLHRDASQTAGFRTAPVKRGELVSTISATGTVEPEEVIDVGAQVAGQILTFGTDANGKPIDYGSTVEQDMVLAQIDQITYAAELASADAQLAQAQAGVTRAAADLAQSKAKLDQGRKDWERAQKLGPSDALAESAYDAYKSAFDVAIAGVAVSDAALVQAKRSVDQAKAARDRDQRNLDYTTIKSPVRGVIIDRRVNIGQTVVASLNAPSLFLIAKDLNRMQVWVAVNEADIGRIHAGQPVTFTVDAFPGQTFRGQVNKVRLNATMTQNVVNFTVEVNTDNSTGKLLPYLTANVQFETGRRDDVLMVPNAALRWTPKAEQIVPEARDAYANAGATGSSSSGRRGSGGKSDRATTRPTTGPTTREAEAVEKRPGTIWVQQGNLVRPIKVTAGLTDAIMTEVHGEGIHEGLEVVIGDQQPQADRSAPTSTNPFAPPPMRGRGSGGGGGGNRGGGAGGAGAPGGAGPRP